MEVRLCPGATLGRFHILRALGEGGMGRVFEAEDTATGARVALKTLRLELGGSPRALARFHREGEIAASLRHPNVVRVVDRGVADGVSYLAMERLDGESLAARLAREGALSDAVDLLLPLVGAVEALHRVGVIHRDLTPDNVILARGEGGATRPTLVDFGVSRAEPGDGAQPLTATGEVLGTPGYMAPEQVQGKPAREAADVYALGVMLYECATGRHPFPQAGRIERYVAIARGAFRPPCAVAPSVAEALQAVILRAMALAPEGRFPSAAALGDALAPLASGDARAL